MALSISKLLGFNPNAIYALLPGYGTRFDDKTVDLFHLEQLMQDLSANLSKLPNHLHTSMSLLAYKYMYINFLLPPFFVSIFVWTHNVMVMKLSTYLQGAQNDIQLTQHIFSPLC